MSIEDIGEKIKGVRQKVLKSHFFGLFSLSKLPALPQGLFVGLVVIFVAFGSFGLGRLSKIEAGKSPIRIERGQQSEVSTPSNILSRTSQGASLPGAIMESGAGRLVGSKVGNKYHYPWCSGALRIADQNRRYFSSKEEAEKAGYTPAANCKGL